MIKEINEPIMERKTEFYALYRHESGYNYHGPYQSQGQMEECLPPGEYTIVTKIKKVVVL